MAQSPPPTTLPSRCSPFAEQLTHNVHAYLAATWTFSSKAYKSAFFAMDVPRSVAFACPNGPIDRLESCALFVCLTGILDDAFSQMSISAAQAIGKKLLAIMTGTAEPDLCNPLEKIVDKIISDLTAQDAEFAKPVIKGAVALFMAQTAEERLGVMQLDEYFAFRFRDVGGEFFLAIARFVNGVRIRMAPCQRGLFAKLEEAVVRHVILVNDVISFDKEVKEAEAGNQEGSAICSAVPILARNLGIGFDGAKRVLWMACRELEGTFDGLADEVRRGVKNGEEKEAAEKYILALRDFASGNEAWSRTTSRYRVDANKVQSNAGTERECL
ncbi:isoprenoid synthase domain-containing protein [Aspergillus egyptiacus]|nr:isoprenoid synthase domain-containing protein [Aspergillus egyptiacus]